MEQNTEKFSIFNSISYFYTFKDNDDFFTFYNVTLKLCLTQHKNMIA